VEKLVPNRGSSYAPSSPDPLLLRYLTYPLQLSGLDKWGSFPPEDVQLLQEGLVVVRRKTRLRILLFADIPAGTCSVVTGGRSR
jgi:hypothetical protein